MFFVHLDALLLGPANFELQFAKNWVSLKTIVNSFVMFFLAVNSFATSLPRVEGDMVLFLCFSVAVPSTMGSHLLDHKVRDRERPVLICDFFGWIRFQPRFVRRCSAQFLDSNREDIENIALLVLFRIPRITLHCPFHESLFSHRH